MSSPSVSSSSGDAIKKIEEDVLRTHDYILKMETRLEKRLDTLAENITQSKAEILTSNDALAVTLDKIDKEVVSSFANYERLARKVSHLEKTVATLAAHAGISFTPVEIE